MDSTIRMLLQQIEMLKAENEMLKEKVKEMNKALVAISEFLKKDTLGL